MPVFPTQHFFAKKSFRASRRCVFSSGRTFGSPDGAFFRQDALSGVPMERFFVRTHFRESRWSVFSPGSTFGSPDGAFFRREALSGTPTEHFFVRKHFRGAATVRFFARKLCPRREFGFFPSGSTFLRQDFAFFRQEALSCGRIPLFFARKHNSRQVPALFLKKKRKGGLGKSLARLL